MLLACTQLRRYEKRKTGEELIYLTFEWQGMKKMCSNAKYVSIRLQRAKVLKICSVPT